MLLNSWSSKEVYERETTELNKQIQLLIDIQSGLGQTSQGYQEDWKHRCEMMNEAQKLGVSVKNALGIL